MGWKYLDGFRWAEVTRDERYFCQHLFNLIRSERLGDFIRFLNRKTSLAFDPRDEWEVAYEVCFFRDLHFLMKEGERRSAKRTFDFCLFSETTIAIIEAKTQQGFVGNHKQLKRFQKDKKDVKELTEKRGIKDVFLFGLASRKHIETLKGKSRESMFDGLFSWGELHEELFPEDVTLARAESLYG